MPRAPNQNARQIERSPGGTLGPLRLNAGPTGSFSAEVHDFSILGVGLVGNLAYPVGTSFQVEAGPRGDTLPTALTAELRHATPRPDGRWLLGCSLSRYLTADDVEVLG